MAVYGAECLISALPRDSSCAACVGGAAAGIGIARGETRDRPFARGGEKDLRRRPSSASTALSRPSSSSRRARSVSSCSSGSAGRFPFRADLSFSRVGLRDCWSANKSPDADWRREQLVPRIRQRWHPSSMSNSHLDFLLTHARPRQRVMSDEMNRTHRYMPR